MQCELLYELFFLLTFRRKVGIDFARGSTVGAGSKFSGRFEVKGLRRNFFMDLINRAEISV